VRRATPRPARRPDLLDVRPRETPRRYSAVPAAPCSDPAPLQCLSLFRPSRGHGRSEDIFPLSSTSPSRSPLYSPSAVHCRRRSRRRLSPPRRPSQPCRRLRLYELCPDRKPSGRRPPGVRRRALSVSTAARTPPSGLSTSSQDRRHIVLREPQGVPADYSDQADGHPDPFVRALVVAPSSSRRGRHLTADSCLRPQSDPTTASSGAASAPCSSTARRPRPFAAPSGYRRRPSHTLVERRLR
jgi:hypothetical protein